MKTLLDQLQERVQKLKEAKAQADQSGRLARSYTARALLPEAELDLANFMGLLQPVYKPKACFNHAMTVAFSLASEKVDGSDITPEMLRKALMQRIVDLDQEQTWEEACLPPFDSYKEESS